MIGEVDPMGRFIGRTIDLEQNEMPVHFGRLVTKLEILLEGVTISNGLDVV